MFNGHLLARNNTHNPTLTTQCALSIDCDIEQDKTPQNIQNYILQHVVHLAHNLTKQREAQRSVAQSKDERSEALFCA